MAPQHLERSVKRIRTNNGIMNLQLLLSVLLTCFVTASAHSFQTKPAPPGAALSSRTTPDVMPGTKPLTPDDDRSITILDNAHLFIEKKIEQALAERSGYWKRDFTSREAYERSVEPNRKRLAKIIGVEDKHQALHSFKLQFREQHPPVVMERFSMNGDPEVIAETPDYRVYQVRWPVLNRLSAEGLLLQPKGAIVANVVAVPDADQTPEQLAGLATGISPESQFARRLAENGYQVLVPVIASRELIFEGTANQQTHREWIYRQAFHMGRHVIGYEVQKILSAIDWFKQEYEKTKTGVAGYHEGGLLALYAGAIDKRIDAVWVSGYFNSRERVWDEPIYRNVHGLLSEFGDAEIASLIAPRALVVEHSNIPEYIERSVNSAETQKYSGWDFTGYKGTLKTPEDASVKREFARIEQITQPGFPQTALFTGRNNTPLLFGSRPSLEKFSASLAGPEALPLGKTSPSDHRSNFSSVDRQLRQITQMEDHVQWLMRDSDYKRNSFYLYAIMPEFEKRQWSTKPHHPSYSPERFITQSKKYRKTFHEDIIGRFEDPLLPANPHTRKLYDNERWTGYEVQLDVYPKLQAAGVILIPKDLKQGERRPVVVVQHGRDGYPQKTIEEGSTAYNQTASKLADRGFIVYAPYNPYRGEDKYRWLVRKATNVGKSMFSFIIAQHDQTLRWLGTLPYVDKDRIAFYGLSFGGETAMRVPSVLEGYCLSIASGDFGDYTRKVVDTHFVRGFMNSMEWEIPVFNMGSTFSHAEMAYLIFPRPFMVERGHDDLVQQSDWVAYEFGKVRYLYDQFGLGDKTEIEYFNGGHSMRGEGTFEFLHKHLGWPQKTNP